MLGTSFIIAGLLAGITLIYQRASLIVMTISAILLWIFAIYFIGWSVGVFVATLVLALIFIPLNALPWRRRYLSLRLLSIYRRLMPSMSQTEKEAISAGTVAWEGDLFRGNPNWQKLLSLPAPQLSAEERAFIDGPLETLCHMINDWEITHDLADLPEEMWRFLKNEGFFGLIIPKKYGGKEFSAVAHSQILVKISSCSITVSTTVAVPNALGPAELLLHYGTEAQKDNYLPRLARGDEIPCFALTSPDAGSDATSMTDYGIVTHGEHNGQKVLGIRLNWNKRYITMAPIATVIGLAFKLYDPDHLLSNQTELGITCALIPRTTPGITIGRRHFPLNTPFQNGPIQGKDVFIPLDFIIGGQAQMGNGWRMLMECLAAGRGITLPGSSLGGAKLLSYVGGAYCRIRKQFNVPIGRFDGVAEPLARIAAATYIIDAARLFIASAIDSGQKPAIASAIVKYHTTELSRIISNDGMDIFGGKAICLGPKNLLARSNQAIPIAITVEGANILTRNLIIFGQGVMRCHPYILSELEAANESNPQKALHNFDKSLMQHIAYAMSNLVRSLALGLTSSRIVYVSTKHYKRYFQHMTRFSSVLAMLADVCMLCYGGQLKRKESISARLGDLLSYLYLLSAVLKHAHDQGNQNEDKSFVQYAGDYCLYNIQNTIVDLLNNLPYRWLSFCLMRIIFPFGKYFNKPSDELIRESAELILTPTAARTRLTTDAFLNGERIVNFEEAFVKIMAAEPIEKIIQKAAQDALLSGYTLKEQAFSAMEKHIISTDQYNLFCTAEDAKQKIIAVDDFASQDLMRIVTHIQLNHEKTKAE